MIATIAHQGSSNVAVISVDNTGADIDLLVREVAGRGLGAAVGTMPSSATRKMQPGKGRQRL